MPTYRAVRWNGIDYPTITAAAKANHVTTRTMHYRISQGYTCDDDMQRSVSVMWDGNRYPNRKTAALAAGVRVQTLSRYLNRGYRSTAQVKRASRRRPLPFITPDGVAHPSLRAAAQALGVPYHTFRRRYYRALVAASPLTEYHLPRPRTATVSVTVAGFTYPSLVLAAKATGISYAKLRRIARAQRTAAPAKP